MSAYRDCMTDFPATTLLDLDLDGAWLTIRLDSPANRNALSDTVMAELVAVLEIVEADPAIRGLTLRGRHGVFCSGGDLKGFQSLQSGDTDHAGFAAMNRHIGDVFDRVQSLPQVVVIFVEGAAIAGGLGLMCCGDVVVVTEDAKFALTETTIGIVPAQIAPLVVARVGVAVARRLMLTASRFTGTEAPQYGLADHVVADAEGFKEVEAEIKKGVMRCAPGANGLTKRILLATPHLDREGQKDFAADTFATAIASDEGREGIASFLEKRKPRWFGTSGN